MFGGADNDMELFHLSTFWTLFLSGEYVTFISKNEEIQKNNRISFIQLVSTSQSDNMPTAKCFFSFC